MEESLSFEEIVEKEIIFYEDNFFLGEISPFSIKIEEEKLKENIFLLVPKGIRIEDVLYWLEMNFQVYISNSLSVVWDIGRNILSKRENNETYNVLIPRRPTLRGEPIVLPLTLLEALLLKVRFPEFLFQEIIVCDYSVVAKEGFPNKFFSPAVYYMTVEEEKRLGENLIVEKQSTVLCLDYFRII